MTDLNKPCDDYCPLLHKCIKYRLEPDEIIKLAAVVNSWEENKKAMDFFSSLGRMVIKFRGSAYG
jgi:hypothetical protein